MGRKLTDDEIAERYRLGDSARTIAAAAGCGHAAVLRVLRRLGVPRRDAAAALRRGPQRDAAAAQLSAAQRQAWAGEHGRKARLRLSPRRMVALYERGLSLREVARLAGCGHPYVLRVLREAGVPTRDRSTAVRLAKRPADTEPMIHVRAIADRLDAAREALTRP